MLLATALACPLIAAPASASLIVNTPVFSTTPTAGQTTTCVPQVLGLPVGSSITMSTGLWGQQTFSTTTTSALVPKLITLADSAGGKVIFCSVSVKPPLLLPAVSAATVVRVQGIAPANKSLPSVSGTTKAGRTVTCRTGTWSALPSSFGIKWLRDGSQVSKGRTRKLTNADRGHAISCSVVAHNPYGSSAAVSSPSRTVS